MKWLSELKPLHGKKAKRLGRGKGSGKGGTSTKGHKGQKARAGVRLKIGFEGGQMPLARRLPKFGFNNKIFKTTYDIVNLNQLSRFNEKVDIQDMIQCKLVRKNKKVKILARGALNKPLKISAHQWSKNAQTAIEKAGGSITAVEKKK